MMSILCMLFLLVSNCFSTSILSVSYTSKTKQKTFIDITLRLTVKHVSLLLQSIQQISNTSIKFLSQIIYCIDVPVYADAEGVQ